MRLSNKTATARVPPAERALPRFDVSLLYSLLSLVEIKICDCAGFSRRLSRSTSYLGGRMSAANLASGRRKIGARLPVGRCVR